MMQNGRVLLIQLVACIALLSPFLWIVFYLGPSPTSRAPHTPRITTIDKTVAGASPHLRSTQLVSHAANDPAVHKLNQLLQQAPTKRPVPFSSLDIRPTMLLSSNCLVTASTLGNLGPPSVVVNPRMDNWLQDRWQAAQDLTGKPIPGPHWLELTFDHPVQEISDMIIDYETAFANDYAIEVCSDGSHDKGFMLTGCKEWKKIFQSSAAKQNIKVTTSPQHVVHQVDVNYSTDKPIQKLRLYIHRPATKWGTSVWRLEVWGRSAM